MLALLDCNNFYASCERVFDPQLAHKPIVVLSNNDGCIIARSHQAKALGIPMGAAYFAWKEKLTGLGVAVRSANFPLYADMSHRVMTILKNHCAKVEPYSIDEAFFEIENMQQAQWLRQIMKQWLGLPVSIGIAPSKTLAKIANLYAKKHEAIAGVCEWHAFSQAEQDTYLRSLAAGDIWGIGYRSAKKLAQANILTAWDVRACSLTLMRTLMHVMGERTVLELRGIPAHTIDPEKKPQQGIMYTRSFGEKITKQADVRAAVAYFAYRAAMKMYRAQLATSYVGISLRTSLYTEAIVHIKDHCVFPSAVASPSKIIETALMLFDRSFKPGVHYYKAGIFLWQLIPASAVANTLFEVPENVSPIWQAVHSIQQQYGEEKMQLASAITSAPWHMKQKLRSPRYTTHLAEVMKVTLN